MKVLPINDDHPTYAAALVVMRAATWPAKIRRGSTFGFPGEHGYSEFWWDDWGRRFEIEKGMREFRTVWTVREVSP